MLTSEQLLLVSGAALVFALVPGPAVIYVITRSADQNRRAGVMSGLGVGTGNLVLVIAAAFGLSALLASSLAAYNTLRYVGAAYLVYLGVRRLMDRSLPEGPGATTPQPLSRIYNQGFLVGLLNPKAALFFLSFLPQFAHRGQGGLATQIMLLGTLVVLITFASDCGYAFLAGGIAQALLRKPHVVRRQQVVAGCVYVGLGVVAALNGPSSTKAAA
jgi:threonine/homoserine/homoserine lactone efflux protein